LLTSEHPEPHAVLSETSTTTPHCVLSHRMTEQEQAIFYRLLIDLFVDNPKRKHHPTHEGIETSENISTEQTRIRPKRQSPTATH